MKYQYTTGSNPDFKDLCIESKKELNIEYSNDMDRINHIPFHSLNEIHDVILIYHKGIAIGCGSFKTYNKKTAEVNHIYLKSRYRRMGYMTELLYQLEVLAKRSGYEYLYIKAEYISLEAYSFFHSVGFQSINPSSSYPRIKHNRLLKAIKSW